MTYASASLVRTVYISILTKCLRKEINSRKCEKCAFSFEKYKVPEDSSEKIPANFPREPVIAWAISFPQSARPDERVEYVINKVKQRELFGTADEDEVLVLEDE